MANARRAPMTVDPVTGELRRARVQQGKHTSGCMQIDEKYLHAARDAGLGGSAGMYGHMSVFKRTGADVLRPSDNAAAGPGDLGGGVAPEDVAGAPKSFLFSTGHGARANGQPQARKTLRERVGASNKPRGGGSVKAQKRGGNVRRMVQGRSHRVAAGNDAGDSAFSKSKGVVAGLHGVTNVKLHNQKARHGVAGGAARPRVGGGRGGAPAGTRVHTTAKGGKVHMLSHAGDRSCRAGGAGVSASAAARGSSVMSGGIRVTAPASKRPAAAKPAATKGRRAAAIGASRGTRPAPVAGRRAAPKASGSGRGSRSGGGAGGGLGARARRPAGGAAGRTLGSGGGPSATPASAAELREARAKYFEKALGAA